MAVHSLGDSLIMFCQLSPTRTATCVASCKRCFAVDMYGRSFNGIFMLHVGSVQHYKSNEVLGVMIETTPYTTSHQRRASSYGIPTHAH